MIALIRERRDIILSFREAVDIGASSQVLSYWHNELAANLRDIKSRTDLATNVLRADDLAHRWATVRINQTSTYHINRNAWTWR